MKKICWIVSLLLTTAGTSMAQKVKHVILVSIDGFRPNFYREQQWPAPNLQFMSANGASSDGVRGVFPTVTYPSHTTIITGAVPGKHGIYYNTPFEPQGATGLWNSEFSLIRTETIWEAVRKAGKTTASVSWPVSVGAPIDYNIPETFTLKNPGDRRQPTSEQSTPKGLFEEVQEHATGKMEAHDLNINYHKMDENIGRMAAYLFKTYKPALLTLHLPGVDHAQHTEGRNGQMVNIAIATADRALGSLLETIQMAGLQDSTAIIITGDHGFVDIHTSISPNIWLVKAGLMDAEKGAGRKWKAMFQTTGGSAFLLLKDSTDQQTLKQVEKLLEELPASYKKLFRVMNREEVRKSGADPHAVLALAPIPGIAMNAAVSGNILNAAKGGTHGYFPGFQDIKTGFVGYGPAFGAGTIIPEMGLEDVAPSVAYLLGIPFNAPDGVVLPGITKIK